MDILVILGEGGHTTEILKLIELLGAKNKYSYIITTEDNLSKEKIKIAGKIFRFKRPRGKNNKIFKSVLNTIDVAIKSFFIFLKKRPTAIITTGPAIAVPVSIIGKIFRIKIIFIETGSRISFVSLTGKILYFFADLYFVQWPQLKEKLPKAIYAGRLI